MNILVGIDGTGSEDWLCITGQNSHVFRFVQDFVDETGENKKYLHGPNLDGSQIPTIVNDAVQFIKKRILEAIGKRIKISDIKVNLIGHSRGALAAILIANKLANLPLTEDEWCVAREIVQTYPQNLTTNEIEQIFTSGRVGQTSYNILPNRLPDISILGYKLPKIPDISILGIEGHRTEIMAHEMHLTVNFLGLYDAVDRANADVWKDTSIPNVVNAAHAVRKHPYLSRSSFSNIFLPGVLEMKFDTTHGGIGGDPGFFTKVGFGDSWAPDTYASQYALALIFEDNPDGRIESERDTCYKNSMWNILSDFNPFTIQSTLSDIRLQPNIINVKLIYEGSKEADKFIRNSAVKAGVSFSTKETPHVPYRTTESKLGTYLLQLLSSIQI